MNRYIVDLFLNEDTGRSKWGVFDRVDGTWQFPARGGRDQSVGLAFRLNKDSTGKQE